MIVTKKQYDYDISRLENDIDRLNNLYWDLYHKHDRLMNHLNLMEKQVNYTELVPIKGFPEKNKGGE